MSAVLAAAPGAAAASSAAAAGAAPWPPHHAVAWLPGSLPMGGVVLHTPIHAFAQPAPALALRRQRSAVPTRHGIELDGLLAFVIRDLLDADECAALIEASERFGYRPEAPGIQTPPGMRMNQTVHWVADDALLGPLFQRMAHLLPPEVDGARLHPRLSHRLNMYRYRDGDVFNRHIDGDWPGFELDETRCTLRQWPGRLRSALTMLLYLNGPAEGVQGGATRLLTHGGGHVDVTPERGSSLFFRHGFGPGSVPHVGCMVHGPVPKYVARINVMFEAP